MAMLAVLALGPGAAQADCVDGRPINVGHRGAGNSSAENPYPENTIPSLLAAAEQGATMVEIDVQISADGVPKGRADERGTDRQPSMPKKRRQPSRPSIVMSSRRVGRQSSPVNRSICSTSMSSPNDVRRSPFNS